MFLLPVGSTGHVVHSGAFGARNVDTLFFMLRWDQNGYDKMRAGTCYAELMFLHLVGYTSDEVNSGAFGVQNVDALFFLLEWDRHGFDKKRVGARYAKLCFYIRWDLWVA
jgi:hypothetical protein